MSATISVSIGPFVVGEKPIPLEYQFQDSNGSPINLTGWAAKINVREQRSQMAIQATATLSGTPTDGKVTYQWSGTEFTTPGHYLAEIWVGDLNRRLASALIEFDVRAPVGPVPNV